MKKSKISFLIIAFLLANFSNIGSLNAQSAQSKKLMEKGIAYQVGVDDILDINVIKPQPFASIVTVAPDGAITFPYIGSIHVKGMALSEIQEEVQSRLADGYMEYPVVSVSLKQSRSKKFTIYGQVIRPGTYPVEENMSILRTITVAGGFIVSGSTGKVKLLRPLPNSTKSEIIEWDIEAILKGAGYDVYVSAEDTITVSVDKFFISGQVNRPGGYPVEENMTLLKAVTVAGGFIESGATGKIKIMRSQADAKKIEIIELDIETVLSGKAQDVIVRSDDTIVVSAGKFFVYGEVNRPGMYPLETNTTVLTAISMSGGFIQSGSTGKVRLFRSDPINREAEVYELEIKSILSGASDDVTIVPGDTIVVSADKFFISGNVNRPGSYPIEENMTLLRAITVGGGFVESDSTGMVKLIRSKASQGDSDFKIFQTDIESVLIGNNQDVVVQTGDNIVVSSGKFFVYGEVNRPGMYPLETKTTVLTAISMSGGFTKFGSASRVKVLRMNEKTSRYDSQDVNLKNVISGNANAGDLIKSGDIVVVSEGAF